jgi:peptidoglycan/LPS O-acetylase OafA/YrhL
MVDMGKVSYSLYLLHMLCFIVIAKIINPTTPAGVVLYIFVSAVVSFIVAKASFKLIEEPAIQLGRNPIGPDGGERVAPPWEVDGMSRGPLPSPQSPPWRGLPPAPPPAPPSWPDNARR